MDSQRVKREFRPLEQIHLLPQISIITAFLLPLPPFFPFHEERRIQQNGRATTGRIDVDRPRERINKRWYFPPEFSYPRWIKLTSDGTRDFIFTIIAPRGAGRSRSHLALCYAFKLKFQRLSLLLFPRGEINFLSRYRIFCKLNFSIFLPNAGVIPLLTCVSYSCP